MRAVLIPLFALVACADAPDLDGVDAEAISFSRGMDDDAAEGECSDFDCPWGETGTFWTAGVQLSEDQWDGVIEDVGVDWCAERLCRDCSTGGEAECEYDFHVFLKTEDDGAKAKAEMYCLCPLWDTATTSDVSD